MALFEPAEWSFAETAADLVTTNPFHPGWILKQRRLLGQAARDVGEVYSWQPGWGLWGSRPNYPDVAQLGDRIDELGDRLRRRLHDGVSATDRELGQYETLSLYRLYRKYGATLDRSIDAAVRRDGRKLDRSGKGQGEGPNDVKRMWDDFRRDHAALFDINGHDFPLKLGPEHLFACFFLLRRAFYHIFFNIVGTSRPVALLRVAVWESIVTHDLRG